MASFKGEIYSKQLEMDIALNIILPYDKPNSPAQAPCKVLYLLHGQGSSSASWTRWTSIERYAMKHGIAVIMPEVQRSFYRDMEYGLKYFSFVADELPELCSAMFGISRKREDNFIAGLSMGGYGALKIGLLRSQNFAAIGSFSGAADLKNVLLRHADNASASAVNELKGIFGLDLELQHDDDVMQLIEEHAKLPAAQQCKFFVTCGTEDEIPGLYEGNLKFVEKIKELNISHEYKEWHGTHEWGFWDTSVQYFLDYITENPSLGGR